MKKRLKMEKDFRGANLQFLLLVFALCSFSFAAAPPLGGDLPGKVSEAKAGDDYDRELLGDPDKPDGKGAAEDLLQKKLWQELGAAAQREDALKDPLQQVPDEMRDIVPRLGNRDSGKVTQYLQRQIVAHLDGLIEKAKKSGTKTNPKGSGSRPKGIAQQKSGEAGSPSEQASSPATISDPRLRKLAPDRAVELARAREQMINVFHADLPPHERQKVLEEAGEYFLPEYKDEIEDYFRRLSQDEGERERR